MKDWYDIIEEYDSIDRPVTEPEPEPEPEPKEAGGIVRAIKRGGPLLAAEFAGLGAAIADIPEWAEKNVPPGTVGFGGPFRGEKYGEPVEGNVVSNKLLDLSSNLTKYAEETFPREFQSYKDIKDFAGFGRWFFEQVGEQAPMMLASLGAGWVARAAKLGKAGIYAAYGLPTAAEVGGGAYTEMGDSRDPAAAIGAGAIGMMLEAVPGADQLRRLGLLNKFQSQVAKNIKHDPFLKSVFKAIGTQSIKEGITEAPQEFVQLAAVYTADKDKDLFGPEFIAEVVPRMKEAFVSAAAVGGFYGGAGQTASRTFGLDKQPAAQPERLTAEKPAVPGSVELHPDAAERAWSMIERGTPDAEGWIYLPTENKEMATKLQTELADFIVAQEEDINVELQTTPDGQLRIREAIPPLSEGRERGGVAPAVKELVREKIAVDYDPDRAVTMKTLLDDEGRPEVTEESYKQTLADHGLPEDTDPADIAILGENTDTQIYLHKDASVYDVVEEVFEQNWSQADTQTRNNVRSQLKEYETMNGKLSEGNELERLSDLVKAAALNQKLHRKLGFKLRELVTRFRGHIHDLLGKSRKLRQQIRDGKVSDKFLKSLHDVLYAQKEGEEVGQAVDEAEEIVPVTKKKVPVPKKEKIGFPKTELQREGIIRQRMESERLKYKNNVIKAIEQNRELPEYETDEDLWARIELEQEEQDKKVEGYQKTQSEKLKLQQRIAEIELEEEKQRSAILTDRLRNIEARRKAGEDFDENDLPFPERTETESQAKKRRYQQALNELYPSKPVTKKKVPVPKKKVARGEAGVVTEGWTKEKSEAVEAKWQKRRREWIDAERKKNPDFAPDIESRKELLSPSQLEEVKEYEELRYKVTALQGPDKGYKPFKLTDKEKTRLAELRNKYSYIYHPITKEAISERVPEAGEAGVVTEGKMVKLPDATKTKEVIFDGTLFHNTTEESAQEILSKGFTVEDTSGLSAQERGFVTGNLGDGIYLSPDFAENQNLAARAGVGGDANLIIKPKKPLKLFNLGDKEGAAQVSLELTDNIRKQGFDGIIVNDPNPQSGGFQLVVFDPKNLKVESIVEQTDISPEELSRIDVKITQAQPQSVTESGGIPEQQAAEDVGEGVAGKQLEAISLGGGEYGGVVIHPSARAEGKTQATTFTKEGKPWGHEEYDTLEDAVMANIEEIPELSPKNKVKLVKAWEKAKFDSPLSDMVKDKKYAYASPLRPLSGVSNLDGTVIDVGNIGVVFTDKPIKGTQVKHLSLVPITLDAQRASVTDYLAAQPTAGSPVVGPSQAKPGEKAVLVKPPMSYVHAVKNANGKYEVEMGTKAPDNPFTNEIFTGEFDTAQIARKSYEAWFYKQQSQTTKESSAQKKLPVPRRQALIFRPKELTKKEQAAVAKPTESTWDTIKDVWKKWWAERDDEGMAATITARNLREEIHNAVKSESKMRGIAGRTAINRLAAKADAAILLHIDIKNAAAHGQTLQSLLGQYGRKLSADQQAIIDQSQSLSPKLQAIANRIIDMNKKSGEQALSEGVIRNALENYAARLWKQEGRKGVPAIKFGVTPGGRQRQRTLGSIIEGWAKGKTLAINTATSSYETARYQVVQAIADKRMIQMTKTAGVMGTKKKHDWIKVDVSGARGWKWIGSVESEESKVYSRKLMMVQDPDWQKHQDIYLSTELYADPTLAKMLKTALGESSLDSAWWKWLTRWNAILKGSVLFTSLYHPQAFLRSFYLASRVGLKYFTSSGKAWREGKDAIEKYIPELRELVRGGLTLFRQQDWERMTAGDRTLIGKWADKNKATAEIKDKVLDLWEAQNKFIFEKLGAYLKTSSALLEYRHLKKKYKNELVSGEMTLEEVAEMAASLANNDFGGLHLRRGTGSLKGFEAPRNQTTQHIFRLLALAPDWTESNVRTAIKAFKKGKEGAMYRAFWGRIAYMGMGATILFNIALAGIDDELDFWERYQRAWEEGNLRWLDVDITPTYKATYKALGLEPSETRKYFSVLGHLRDPIKFILNPGRIAKHKSSILGRFWDDWRSGKDWAGREFTSMSDLTKTGQLVSWKPEKKATDIEKMPSLLLYEARSVMPIQTQQLLAWLTGEIEGWDAVTKSLGFMTSTSYPEKRKHKRR